MRTRLYTYVHISSSINVSNDIVRSYGKFYTHIFVVFKLLNH